MAAPKKKTQQRRVDELSESAATEWIAWEAPEFAYYEKSWLWTTAVLFVAFSLVGIFYQMRDYSAMAVVAAGTLVFIQQAWIRPKTLRYAISSDGIQVGERAYAWSELKSFWLIESTSQPHLYLETTGRWLPTRTIYLKNVESAEVRARLAQHLPERTTQGEQASEIASRLLKF